MFDNNTGIFEYDYQLELETIINGICNISFDIGIQIDNVDLEKIKEIEYAKELFEDGLFELLSIRKNDLEEKGENEEYNFTKEDFFSEIANYYNKSIFFNSEILDYLNGSDILFINKKEGLFYASDEKNSKTRITSAIKNGKILNDIIDKIKNIKIKNSLNKINLFEHNAFYGNTIKTIKKEGQPIIPIINFDLINNELINVELEDFDNYWINAEVYKKKYNVTLPDDERFLITDKTNGNVIGIKIGNNLIPSANIILIDYILEEKNADFFWLLFKFTYSENTHKAIVENALVNDFKKLIKDRELNQLLSNLKNNLYLDNKIIIKKEFEHFFNKVALIEKLDYLEEYEFLIPQSVAEETALGIYTKEKKGSSYNLLHWLNHKKELNLSHFRGNTPTKKGKQLISTLKPEICFYFLEKYFEDLLENILKENGYKYLSNIKFSRKSPAFDCEVDFLLFNQNKFYYIEAKTKLSKDYIEGFLKKASDLIDKFDQILSKNIEFHFVLLGAYSDDNVKSFQYFIDSGQVPSGYNIHRENLKSIPYKFIIPIPDKKGKEILCIAEPEYDSLTKLILEICPK